MSIFSKAKKENVIKVFEYHPVPEGRHVIPAPEEIPLWWKKMDTHGGFDGRPSGDSSIDMSLGIDSPTIKKCVPVLDAMTMGYLIKTHAEIQVRRYQGSDRSPSDDTCPQEEFIINATYPIRIDPELQSKTGAHPFGQSIHHPLMQKSGQRLQKIFVPWHIMTPPGYSVIICDPLNNQNEYIELLPGVLDSDQYFPRINLMGILRDPNFDGIIPIGTPIAQVIPFKRESWTAYISDSKEDMEYASQLAVKGYAKLTSVFRAPYKKFFWSRKSFK